tara:strand:+ start:583 stop:1110 length:528 start_codon:yes stop_codon:yes gene_type:complete
MKNYRTFLQESNNYKDPLSDKKFISELIKLLSKLGMEDIELDGNDLSFHNPTHLDTGPIGKPKGADKIEKLIQKFGYNDDEFLIRSSLIEIPDEYVAETIMFQNNSGSVDADKIAAYSDMSPEQRKELDDYCKMKFGNQFINCSYEEQSAARSTVWASKEEPEEIKQQQDRNAKM